MSDRHSEPTRDGVANPDQRGSGLVIAIFVLFLVTSLGVALLFLSQTEIKLSQADLRTKTVYYFSEAGLEDGRATVHATNQFSTNPLSLEDELVTAAGPDGALDFDLSTLTPVFDSDGRLTGVTGFNDDVPPRGLTVFSDGRYLTFLTNDPGETGGIGGIHSLVDDNDRVMLTGVGAGPDRSLEIVQAIVERRELYPELPAAITILGETNCAPNCAHFDGGTSTPKKYVGDDTGPHCPGGMAGLYKPVVGVIGGSSVTSAQSGVQKPGSYSSGPDGGLATVKDLTTTGTLNPMWTNCDEIVEFAAMVRELADLVGNSTTPTTDLGVPGDGKVVFIDGDYAIPGGVSGAGVLFVTGDLDFNGQAQWEGAIFAVGTGDFIRSGGGNGDITGGILVADVAGPDRVLFTADDCSGEDGIMGTADDGIAQSSYDVPGAGNSTTGYCSADLVNWMAFRPLEIVSFVQR